MKTDGSSRMKHYGYEEGSKDNVLVTVLILTSAEMHSNIDNRQKRPTTIKFIGKLKSEMVIPATELSSENQCRPIWQGQ